MEVEISAIQAVMDTSPSMMTKDILAEAAVMVKATPAVGMKARKTAIIELTEGDMVPTIQTGSRKVTAATGAAGTAEKAIIQKAGAAKQDPAEAVAIQAQEITAAGDLGAEDIQAADIPAE